jgi:hypothetical protein
LFEEIAMTDQAAPMTSAGRPRKAASVGGQALGVVGVVVSIVLILLVVLGRGWATGEISDAAGTIDAGLARGGPLLTNAASKIGNVQARIVAVGDAATLVANSSTPALATALSERINSISEPYLALRNTYNDARTGATSTLDRIALVNRLIPGFQLPQGPVDALASLDAKVQAVDSVVLGIINANSSGELGGGIAAAIAAKAQQVATALDGVTESLSDAQARLQQARVNVATTADNINLTITIISLIAIALLVYLALLHVVLFRSAGGMRREAPAPEITPATT